MTNSFEAGIESVGDIPEHFHYSIRIVGAIWHLSNGNQFGVSECEQITQFSPIYRFFLCLHFGGIAFTLHYLLFTLYRCSRVHENSLSQANEF